MSSVNLSPVNTIKPIATPKLAGAPARTEIAFVLDNVADWQTLAAGVRAGVEVVVLDSTGDGLAQMAAYLASKTPGSVDAIHLLGHGSSGSLNLGALTLNTGNLQQHAATLAQIGGALTADGDWLLYGCNVAEGAAGLNLLGQLAQASGADVAASSDLTGGTALGGDWVLEQTAGALGTAAFDVAGFEQLLADVVIGNLSADTLSSTTSGIGQSFIATKTGVLTSIKLALNSANSNTTLKIYQGEGTAGTLLVTQTGINLTDTVTDATNFTLSDIALTTPISITNGSTYTFILDNGATNVGVAYSAANPYGGGFLYTGAAGLSGLDLVFQVVQGDSTNTAPVITSGSTGSVAENAATSTVVYQTTATDADSGQTLAYSLSGTDASLLSINATSGAVTLVTSADFETKASYSFNVIATDNGTAALSATKAITLSISDVNEANTRPVLDATKSPVLGSIAANLGAPANGTTTNSVLVSSLIDTVNSADLDNYTDANNNPAGIAVTGVSSNGKLWYSTNGGTNWTELTGTVSATSALTLKADANTRVYFQPAANYSGTLTNAITLQAWDQTGGFTNGQTGVSTTGGVVGSYNTTGSAYGVALNGNYAYVADDTSGLQIFNISAPTTPTLTGTYNTPGFANVVALSGSYAYVGDSSSGLQIINISNPAAPTLVGSFNTPGSAYGVAISGNYAYVGDARSGLQIINISNPATPTLAGALDTTGSANGVAVSGNYAYVADGASGLQIINISNPATPTLAGTLDTTGSAYGVAVSGNYAYVADGSSGLQIINISNPASPSLVGTYDTPRNAYAVAVNGNIATVSDVNGGVLRIDISNPASPSLVATFASIIAVSVAQSGDYLYTGSMYDGLKVISLGSDAFSTASDTVSVSVLSNSAPSATAVTIPTFTDTSAANTFTDATGTLAFTDTESNSFTLSLTGSSAATYTANSVTYDLSKTSPYGTLYLVSTGADKGKYLFDPDDAAINKLTSSTFVDFAVSATDNGTPAATGLTTIKVNVTGANDTPVLLAPTAIGMVDTAQPDTQAGLITAASNNSGTLSASDAENGALTYGITAGTTGGSTVVNSVTYDVSKAGTNGTLYVNSSTGGYVFVPTASAVNALAAGSTSETFTVTSSDGSLSGSQTLTVNYTGANDTPVITSSNPPTALQYVDTTAADTFSNLPNPLTALVGTDAEGAVTYGVSTGATGGSDTVNGITYDVSKVGTYGTLYLKSTGPDAGKYVYVPNAAAINALAATNKTESFTLTLTDSSAGSVSTLLEVKLVGADDVPVIDTVSLNLADTAAPDTFSTPTGTLKALDVDTTGATSTTLTYGINSGTTGGSTVLGAVTYDVSKAGTYGTLYVKSADGSYAYVPVASAVNALTANSTDSFTISASDGAGPPGIGTNTFTVNMSAVNDAPLLTTPTAIALSDTASTDSFTHQTGTLNATDAEGTALSYALTGATTGGATSFSGVTYDLSLAGKYGTLYLVSTGADKGKYIYVPDATKINALTADAVDSFGVGAGDGTLSLNPAVTPWPVIHLAA
jgi:VCBS repeat-containing protein